MTEAVCPKRREPHWPKKVSSSDPVTGIPSLALRASDFF